MRAIACLTLFVAIASPVWAADPPTTQPEGVVRVVKNMKELLAQPRIDLGNGAGARLGISAGSAPKDSGILIYCLAENHVPRSEFNEDGLPLGPFDVLVSRGGQPAPKASTHFQIVSNLDAASPHLYVRTIPIISRAAHLVSVRYAAKEVAKFPIAVPADDFHPWFPFDRPRPAPNQEQPPPGAEPITRVANPGSGAALPTWLDFIPTATLELEIEKDSALPQLFPNRPTDEFKISMLDRDLLIELAPGLDRRDRYAYLLTRWWINGKPFTGENAPQDEVPSREPVLAGTVKQVRLKIEFYPERMGAKPGDRIELQLLYCPRSWITARADGMLQSSPRIRSPIAPAMLSNKVEFVVP